MELMSQKGYDKLVAELRLLETVLLFCKVEMNNLANNSRMTYTIASPHEANLQKGIIIKQPVKEVQDYF